MAWLITETCQFEVGLLRFLLVWDCQCMVFFLPGNYESGSKTESMRRRLF